MKSFRSVSVTLIVWTLGAAPVAAQGGGTRSLETAPVVSRQLEKTISIPGDLTPYQSVNIHAKVTYATMPVVPINTSTALQFTSLLEHDGISLMFGLGAEYRLNERITVRGEWERFNDIRIGGNWVDMFSVGMSYHFNVM